MAFGKSHRDPYATSVGHLVGKEARGVTSRLVWGTVGALPVPLHSRLGLRGDELDQVGGNATLPRSFPTPPACHLWPLSTFLVLAHSDQNLSGKMQNSKC